MDRPRDRLASALDALRRLQDRGEVAIRATDLKRLDRERLLRAGFLRKVVKGWYIPARPDQAPGESTAWYASFWPFCAAYLGRRFGKAWCLSPEQSILLLVGNRTVPRQLLVRAQRGNNAVTALPFGTSLLDIRAGLPPANEVEERDGLRLLAMPAALIAAGPGFFTSHATDARAALAAIPDASELLRRLLEGGHSTIAGRLAGAFRNIGRDRLADDIAGAMAAAGYSLRVQDPFAVRVGPVLPGRAAAITHRLRLMWQAMRGAAIDSFPKAPGRPRHATAYLQRVRDVYTADAYHSLSIEGYRVSPALIERVRSGRWNPDADTRDRGHSDALAARGYWLAFQAVQRSLGSVLRGDDPGAVAEADHSLWYREMFSPGVAAGLHRPADLAGYRSGPVFIRRSLHIPPAAAAVRDAMPVLFELLSAEAEPAARAVLGHFVFVYVHPYADGNGRIGRFLMNVMLASGGYPWSIIPVERRAAYMAALEEASAGQNIAPFAGFVSGIVTAAMAGGGEQGPAAAPPPPARPPSTPRSPRPRGR